MDTKRRKTPNISQAENSNSESDDAQGKNQNNSSIWILLTSAISIILLVVYITERRHRIGLETSNLGLLSTIDFLKIEVEEAKLALTVHNCPECKCPSCPVCEVTKDLEKQVSKTSNKLKQLQSRNELLENSRERIIHGLQLASKELVILKYGPGPHQVELELQLPFNLQGGKIVIELAHISLMPHAVLHFLSQVAAGAWNGCNFIRNAHHVLQAGCDKGWKDFKAIPWIDKGVSFQEYHKEFPHLPLTIGLAGRPGGPDFYINLVDNVNNHGPGGQSSYAMPEEADSCFGKVITGNEVIQNMKKIDVEPGGFRQMKQPVVILSAKIIKKEIMGT